MTPLHTALAARLNIAASTPSPVTGSKDTAEPLTPHQHQKALTAWLCDVRKRAGDPPPQSHTVTSTATTGTRSRSLLPGSLVTIKPSARFPYVRTGVVAAHTKETAIVWTINSQGKHTMVAHPIRAICHCYIP